MEAAVELPPGVKLIRRNERREIRKAVRLPCEVRRASNRGLVSRVAVDLSPDGMLAFADELADVGDELLVGFHATYLGLRFETEAVVERVTLGRRDGDHSRALGLRFTTLDRVKRLILRGQLRRVPPPLPRRAQRIDWTATIRSLHA